jgi:hypothetical protein
MSYTFQDILELKVLRPIDEINPRRICEESTLGSASELRAGANLKDLVNMSLSHSTIHSFPRIVS